MNLVSAVVVKNISDVAVNNSILYIRRYKCGLRFQMDTPEYIIISYR